MRWRNMVIIYFIMWRFPEIGVPQTIHFRRIFNYKPSNYGVPSFMETHSKSYIKPILAIINNTLTI